MSPPTPHAGYDAVVFAGGGCRCFWSAGFWTEAAPALDLAPRQVAGVSAGSAFACAIFGGVLESVIEDFLERVAANQRNVYPANALRREPIFPHERIYRSTILDNLDERALRRLRSGPDVRVSIARPPGRVGARVGFLLAAMAYQGDRSGKRVHAAWGRRLGFETEIVSVRQCETPEELADLILHSSCTPPVMPFYHRDGRAVLDGGLVDNAPVEAVEPAEQVLVLLTRHRPEEDLPCVPGRTYVQPSEPLPIDKWDYTSPEGVREAFDLGRRDGEAFARSTAQSAA
ncbi:MAG: patatin-like phospholipase family protein [Myxococcota bacterium]|nr:patatin-like phospholipase family protein [Myxococcota bacterium]